jgi:MoaA/NifB/PqqE/SkfB family radical SAM enzyme
VAHPLKLAKDLVRARVLGRPAPLHVSWIVTHRCNLRCAYCDRPEIDAAELGPGPALRLVDELADAGCAQLSVTGGDPLVRADLPAILTRARARGLTLKLNTNGLLVRKRLDAVRLVDGVTISLDGPPGPHDAVRGRGAFAGAMAGARAVRELGLPLGFTTVIGRANAAELGAVLDAAEPLGARVMFQPGSARTLGAQTRANGERAGREAYERAIDALVAWKRAGRPVANSLDGLAWLRQWPEPRPMQCMGGALFARVDPDGQVRACGHLPRGPENSALGDGGIRAAMARLARPDCSTCYSAARVELNLIMAGSVDAALNQLRGGRAR